jgi:selenocysteine-specific elongation factor
MLNDLASGSDISKLKAAAWFAGFKGINEESLPLFTGIDPTLIKDQLKLGLEDKALFEINTSTGRKKIIDNQLITDLKIKITTILESLHLENPLISTHERQRITMELTYAGDDLLVQDLIDQMIVQKTLVGNKRRIGLAAFKPKLSNNQRKLIEKIHTTYREAKFAPPPMEDFINHLGGQKIQLQELFNLCVQEGKLVCLQDDLFLEYDVEQEMRYTVSSALESGKGMTVAEIRDLLKTSRKYAVPFCEHLDKIGTTRREGDLRYLASKQIKSQQEKT